MWIIFNRIAELLRGTTYALEVKIIGHDVSQADDEPAAIWQLLEELNVALEG
jgi:Cu/Ag efflux pump CusA